MTYTMGIVWVLFSISPGAVLPPVTITSEHGHRATVPIADIGLLLIVMQLE
jgi:hypothetical protein